MHLADHKYIDADISKSMPRRDVEIYIHVTAFVLKAVTSVGSGEAEKVAWVWHGARVWTS